MAQLITVQELKDYSLNQKAPNGIPASLTDAIIGVYITAATADILQWAGLTAIPSASLQLDSLKERCRELATARIDSVFFGMKTEVQEGIEARIRNVLTDTEETEEHRPRSSITPTRRFTRYTENHDLVELDP